MKKRPEPPKPKPRPPLSLSEQVRRIMRDPTLTDKEALQKVRELVEKKEANR